MLLASGLVCALIFAAPPPAGVHPDIWVQPAPVPAPPGDAPEIPWLSHEPANWSHAPVVHLRAGPDDPNARVWVAMTDQHFYLHVVVYDTHHVNDQSGDAIWNDDAIQVAIDPRGEAKTLPRQGAQTLQPGSLAASFALTKHGVRAWVHTRTSGDPPGPLLTPGRIERDAARHTTTYDVVLPWTLLNTVPGESATLGLQVEVNDRNPTGILRRASYGDSPPGTLDGTQLKTLRLATPSAGVLRLAPHALNIWRPADAACAWVITNESSALHADVQFGETQRTVHWQNTGPALQRWQVCVAPRQLLEAPMAWSVVVTGASQTVRGAYTAQSPSISAERDLAAMRDLAAAAQPALARRHLAATHAVLQSVWSAALTALDDGDAAARAAATAIAQSRSRLPPTVDALERSLQRGERPLLAVFQSSEDGTLQPYTLTLPRVLDAEHAQPVLVFLHGKGTPSVAGFVAEAQATRNAPWERAYMLHPWGRGNIGYRGFAETDVLDALAHADSLFHFDGERVWLGGFSMGGAGAWRAAVHHPDRWAAVAIFAGQAEGVPMGVGFGGNLAHLPAYLHHGLADGATAVSGIAAMQDELEKNGGKPTVIFEPGGGHVLTQQHQRELRDWLGERTRPQPKVVHFVSDTPGQAAFGITLQHDAKQVTFPRYVVHVDGRQLRIDTVGTNGLDIDLRERAWGFTDVCRVTWNGTQVYDGPPMMLHLGVGAS